MVKAFTFIVCILLLIGGAVLGFKNLPSSGFSSTDSKSLTFQAAYTPEGVVKTQSRHALQMSRDSQWSSKILLVPHLLVKVKKRDNQGRHSQTQVLWDMVKGELVTSLRDWHTSEIFYDLLQKKLDEQEVKLLKSISLFKEPVSLKELKQVYSFDETTLQLALESALKKKILVFQKGSYHSYFQGLSLEPFFIEGKFPRQHYLGKGTVLSAKFSEEEILKLLGSLLDAQHLVSGAKQVFLPIYQIEIKDEKRSPQLFYFNAITGEEVKAWGLS